MKYLFFYLQTFESDTQNLHLLKQDQKETECGHSSIVSRLLNNHNYNQISFIADNSDKSKNFVQKSFLYVMG